MVENRTVRTTKKSTGIVFISLYTVLMTIGSLYGGLIISVGGFAKSIYAAAVYGAINLLWGIFAIPAIYGLWTLSEWGRKLALKLYTVFIFLALVGIFVPDPLDTPLAVAVISNLIFITLTIAVILYRSKPKVRDLFT